MYSVSVRSRCLLDSENAEMHLYAYALLLSNATASECQVHVSLCGLPAGILKLPSNVIITVDFYGLARNIQMRLNARNKYKEAQRLINLEIPVLVRSLK